MPYEEVKGKMEKALESLKKNFSGVRTGRANPALVENVNVEVYGQKMPLRQIASISVPENKTIVIAPFDHNNMQAIEKAISASDLGLTPQSDKNIIRLRLPDLTQQRREELMKIIRNLAEEGKVVLRNIRRDTLDSIKKNSTYSEDDRKMHHDKIQKVIDEYVAKIDHLVKNKEAEIKEI